MKTPNEIMRELYPKLWDNLKLEDTYKIGKAIRHAQQDAFEAGRDKALEWASIRTSACIISGKDINKDSILNGKTAPELQFKK